MPKYQEIGASIIFLLILLMSLASCRPDETSTPPPTATPSSRWEAYESALADAFLPAALPEAARSRLFQPVAGGRFAAVAAVLGLLFFQRRYPRTKLPNRSLEQGDYSFYSLFVGFLDFRSGRHHVACHSAILAGLYDLASRLWLSSYNSVPYLRIIRIAVRGIVLLFWGQKGESDHV